MMVIWLGLMPIWRKISGSTPWPIEPKPIMTMRPLNETYCLVRVALRAVFFAMIASPIDGIPVVKRRRGLSQGPVGDPFKKL
jgi:hypothetical protein